MLILQHTFEPDPEFAISQTGFEFLPGANLLAQSLLFLDQNLEMRIDGAGIEFFFQVR